MQVNTNIPALVAANAINLATQQAAQASQRISTSMRVNSSADDPGLMSVINSTKAKIASWSKANDNISSSSAMLTAMNSSLSSISDLLPKMRALAVTSASANSNDVALLNQSAFNTYMTQIENLVSNTKWNGISLLNAPTIVTVSAKERADEGASTSGQSVTINGISVVTTGTTLTKLSEEINTAAINAPIDTGLYGVTSSVTGSGSNTIISISSSRGDVDITGNLSTLFTDSTKKTVQPYVSVQTGVDAGNLTKIYLYNVSTDSLGETGARLISQNLNTINAASNAITQIDKVLTTISSYQTTIGATQNLMANQSAFNNSMSLANNTAYSHLTGADIAAETANLAAAQIRQNSASAMLAQSDQMTKDMVTTLLKQFVN